jgi:hypothetical protein
MTILDEKANVSETILIALVIDSHGEQVKYSEQGLIGKLTAKL